MNCNICEREGCFNEGIHSKELLFIKNKSHWEEWTVPLCAKHYLLLKRSLKNQGSTITIEFNSGKKVILKNSGKSNN